MVTSCGTELEQVKRLFSLLLFICTYCSGVVVAFVGNHNCGL